MEIGKGNLVRNGSTIEIFDHEAGEHRDVDVQSIRRFGGSVEVEVYDSDSGEYRTPEMDAELSLSDRLCWPALSIRYFWLEGVTKIGSGTHVKRSANVSSVGFRVQSKSLI